jgi:hypothetical protein
LQGMSDQAWSATFYLVYAYICIDLL